jgi:hypothetical protein
MPVVEHSVVIAAGVADAFDLSQSYGLRLEWDPFVRSQSFLQGATAAAKGVRTFTRSRHGLSMISEYITFRRPESVAMKMIEGPGIFRLFSGAWHFRQIDAARTEVTFKYHFKCRPAWLQWVTHPIGRAILGHEISRRLESFRSAAESPSMIQRLHSEIEANAPAASDQQ